MDTIDEQFTSMTWWISVGVAGLLFSVLGNYLVRLLNISFFKTIDFVKFLNDKAKHRANEIKEIEKSKAQELSNDLHEQIIISFIILRIEMRIMLIGIVSILMFMIRFIEIESFEYLNEITSVILFICFGAIIFEFAKSRKWSRVLAEGFKEYKEKQK